MKKLIRILCCFVLLFALTGCDEKVVEIKGQKQEIIGSNKTGKKELEKENRMTETIKGYYDRIEEYLKSDNFKEKEDQVLSYFFQITDFLFYKGEVSGKTLDEVSEDIQSKVLELYQKLDTKLEEKYPDYKERVKEKYGEASETIKEKASSLKDSFLHKIKDTIGEEKYDEYTSKIEEAKGKVKETYENFNEEHGEEMKEKTSNAFEEIKDKISNWYQNFKNNHTK